MTDRRNALEAAAIVMGLRFFAENALRPLAGTGQLDDQAIADLKAATVAYLKNLKGEGTAFEEEAEAIWNAAENVKKLIDIIAVNARR